MTETDATRWLAANGFTFRWCGVCVHVSRGEWVKAYPSCWEAWRELAETTEEGKG